MKIVNMAKLLQRQAQTVQVTHGKLRQRAPVVEGGRPGNLVQSPANSENVVRDIRLVQDAGDTEDPRFANSVGVRAGAIPSKGKE